jgi:hypothetical protein
MEFKDIILTIRKMFKQNSVKLYQYFINYMDIN